MSFCQCSLCLLSAYISRKIETMLQQDDKKILFNIAKVIAVLVVVMFSLIIIASYIGGG